MKAIVLLSSLCLFSCSASEINIPQNSSKIHFSINTDALSSVQVVLKSTLKNSSKKLHFLPWNTPFDTEMGNNFLIVHEISPTGNQKELKYQGRKLKRLAPNDTDFITVNSGELLENEINITKNYNFCKNSKYSIQLRKDILDSDFKNIKSTQNTAVFTTNKSFPDCSK